jgi:hypothetical protein
MPTAVRRVNPGIRPQSDTLNTYAFGLAPFIGSAAAFEVTARQ